MGRPANFMGHDLAIHKQHYRLPSTAMELSETSKLLLIMEGADVEKYRGQTLKNIHGHCSATSDARNNTIAKPTPRPDDRRTTTIRPVPTDCADPDYAPANDVPSDDDASNDSYLSSDRKRSCKLRFFSIPLLFTVNFFFQ